jgi:uncharacterized surface protein with fasciclin (FAS1) repeats
MTTKRSDSTLAAVTAVAVAAVGPASASAGNAVAFSAKKDIVEAAVAAGRFQTLTALLKQAGLVKALKSEGRYTIFAPSDAAFAKVPKNTLNALAGDKAKLRAVLLHHVAKGKPTAANVVKRKSIKTLNGQRVQAFDTMMAHLLALQLRNLQTMVEIGVDKNSTIVFPAPLMSTIQELGAFLSRETAAAAEHTPVAAGPPAGVGAAHANGAPEPAI